MGSTPDNAMLDQPCAMRRAMKGIRSVLHKEDTLLDVLDRYPEAIRVMREYEAETGHCICCEMLFATIEEVATHYRLDLELLMQRLEVRK